ncbi:PPIP2 protein, partial [Cepphus grylle]|nr:PPIP2 protein [Cepphus grylle]
SMNLMSTIGFNSIIQHLNDSRKNCKGFEDFLKERAIIEEKYGKEVIKLLKKQPCGQTELNTLKRSLDVFKQQVDNVGQGHIQLLQTLHEEAKKMEDFREKQKLHQKKIELIMEAIHKNRNLQYKKTTEVKQTCCCFVPYGALLHLFSLSHFWQLFLTLSQTKSALEDSAFRIKEICSHFKDVRAILSVSLQFFETQECKQTNYFRNALWLHVNQLSQDCIQNDKKYEEICKSLEMCSIEKDIYFFVNLCKTGSLAPAPVVYENYYNTQRNATPVRSPVSVPISR